MEGLGSVKQEMLRKQDQCSPASHNNRSLALETTQRQLCERMVGM
jgi:hypothetical protein